MVPRFASDGRGPLPRHADEMPRRGIGAVQNPGERATADEYERCAQCGRRSSLSRGLCNFGVGACYGPALRRVKAGKTTWAELEAAGKARPLKTPAEYVRWPNAE